MALCILFIGCEKEGVYNPNEKIKRISYQYPGGTKQLSQEWTWDKNLLKKIEYFYSYTPVYEERYTYEKNKLTRVDESDGWYWRVFYKDNLYDKAEYYDSRGSVQMSAKFTYDKKKVSRIDLTIFDDGWKSKMSNGGFMSNLFSQELFQEISKISSKSKSRAPSTSFRISFTYDKNNIKERIIEYNEYGYSERYTYKFEKYDNKLNPLYSFYTKFDDFDAFVGSKNNPLEVIVEWRGTYGGESDFERTTITYDYTYNGKFPTEVLRVYRDSDGDTWRYTTYYEYQ